MRYWWLIYLPPVLLLAVAILLPQLGRDLVGRMNGREFALYIAFWWLFVAIIWRLVVGWLVARSRRERNKTQGFDVIQKD